MCIRDSHNLKSSYLTAAKSFFNDAQNYASFPTALGAEIESRISSIPLDTVHKSSPFINAQIYLQPYNIHSNRNRSLHYMQRQDTLFNKRDSSFYNGVLVSGAYLENFRLQKTSYPNQSTVQSFSTIKNGLIVSQSNYRYNFAQIYNSTNVPTYIFYMSAVSLNNDSCFFQFNHLGDTLFYHYYKLNGSDYLKLNAKKDTIEYAHNTIENGIPIRNYVSYRANGDTNGFSRTAHYPDSIVRFASELDEDGNIASYNCLVNDYYRYGIEWNSYSLGYETPPFRITRRWEKNKLMDILTENIIYVNANNEIIDKSEYIATVNSGWNTQLYHAKNYKLEDLLPPADSLIIVYVNNEILRYGKRKYRRSVKSVLSDYEKGL